MKVTFAACQKPVVVSSSSHTNSGTPKTCFRRANAGSVVFSRGFTTGGLQCFKSICVFSLRMHYFLQIHVCANLLIIQMFVKYY